MARRQNGTRLPPPHFSSSILAANIPPQLLPFQSCIVVSLLSSDLEWSRFSSLVSLSFCPFMFGNDAIICPFIYSSLHLIPFRSAVAVCLRSSILLSSFSAFRVDSFRPQFACSFGCYVIAHLIATFSPSPQSTRWLFLSYHRSLCCPRSQPLKQGFVNFIQPFSNSYQRRDKNINISAKSFSEIFPLNTFIVNNLSVWW